MSSSKDEILKKCEQLGKEPKIFMRIPGFIIRNYSPDLYESAQKHIEKYFTESEPINRACNVKIETYQDEMQSRQRMAKMWEQNVSLIILKDDSPGADLKPVPEGSIIEIVGLNRLMISFKSDDKKMDLDKISGNVRRSIEAIRYCINQVNVFELFNVEEYLMGIGLAINESYTGRGMAKLLLKAREPLCKELGIKLTETLYTAPYSQKAAASCGHESFKKILFNEIKNEKGELMFPDYPPDKYALLMAKRIE